MCGPKVVGFTCWSENGYNIPTALRMGRSIVYSYFDLQMETF